MVVNEKEGLTNSLFRVWFVSKRLLERQRDRDFSNLIPNSVSFCNIFFWKEKMLKITRELFQNRKI